MVLLRFVNWLLRAHCRGRLPGSIGYMRFQNVRRANSGVSGFPEWNGKVMLAPGTLSVVTGHPGHGKTHFLAQVWFNILRAHNLVAAVATFESQPKPDFRKILRSLYDGENADDWINDHYVFLIHPEQRPTVEWILDMAEVAVVRHGARAD